MTKIEWQATRTWCDDLAAVTGMDHDYPTGFTYRDGSEHIEAREWGFGVVIGTTEAEFKTLEEAEDYLWAEWADGECNG
jgi:broad specificity phosphatase PhoE